MYGNCVQNTCMNEILELKPHVILAMGQEVFEAVMHTLSFYQEKHEPQYSIRDKYLKRWSDTHIVFFVYHSTGHIAPFRHLQKFLRGNITERPRAFRPYLHMLTGKEYDNTDQYWINARNILDETIMKLKVHFNDWFGDNQVLYRNDELYFACHFNLFKRVWG